MPVLLPTILAVAGTASSIVGSLSKGESAKEASDFNAAIGERNAKLAEAQGIADAKQIRVMSRKATGGIHAAVGASGITSESGSAMDILQESAAAGEMDALKVKHAADLKAWSYRTGAEQERKAGSAARASGRLGALGAGISGLSGLASLKRGTDATD